MFISRVRHKAACVQFVITCCAVYGIPVVSSSIYSSYKIYVDSIIFIYRGWRSPAVVILKRNTEISIKVVAEKL